MSLSETVQRHQYALATVVIVLVPLFLEGVRKYWYHKKHSRPQEQTPGEPPHSD